MKNGLVRKVFAESFQTYRAFENLDQEKAGAGNQRFPATIWQILNHLIIWQEFQLRQLKGLNPLLDVLEQDSWIKERAPLNNQKLREAVEKFHQQLEKIKGIVENHPFSEEEQALDKWKILQELSVHLSFHLGEVVLMRRMLRNYPLPDQMKEFLKEEIG